MKSDTLEKYYGRLKVFKQHGLDLVKTRYFILEKSGIGKSDSVLEVGTGKGHMAIILAKKGFKLVSIDLDKKAQAIVKESLKALKINKLVTLKIMNAEKIRYGNDSFGTFLEIDTNKEGFTKPEFKVYQISQ